MSFFSQQFGADPSVLERQLHDMYTERFSTLGGQTPREAEQMVSKAIVRCKQASKAEGTADLPADYGDRLIEAARMGEPEADAPDWEFTVTRLS